MGSSHGEEFRHWDQRRNTPIIKKSDLDSLFNLFLKTLVLMKSIGGRSNKGYLRVRVSFRVQLRLRVRVQVRVWCRVQVMVRVRVSFRVRARFREIGRASCRERV